MTMASINPTTPSKDIFYAFSLAKTVPDAELLDEFIRRYPEHAVALTEFAVELALDAAQGDADVPINAVTTSVSPVVSRVMSRFQNELFSIERATTADVQRTMDTSPVVQNPFNLLDQPAIRRLTRSINANTMFFLRLRDRVIDPSSITTSFKTRIAEELNVSPEIVENHFAAKAEIQQGQFYKAEQKPEAGAQQSFEAAVRSSGLTDEQQQYLLNL